MTRAEYSAKYGSAPTTPAPAASAPVQMTQAEYDAKYGSAAPAAAAPAAPKSSSFLGNVGSALKGAAKAVFPIESMIASAIPKAPGQIAEAFKGGIERANQGAADTRKSTTPLGKAAGLLKFGSGVSSILSSPTAPLAAPISKAVDAVGGLVGSIPAVQKFAASPAGGLATKIAEPLADAGNIAGTVLGGRSIVKSPLAGTIASGVADKASALVRSPAESADALSRWYATRNAEPQLQTSAQRLQSKAMPRGMGAAMQKPLVDVYNDFASQEAKHIADIKQDPAISLVGQRIGNAFESVVKQRQAAGKTMSAELAKTASKPVDTQAAFGKLQSELLDNGVKYDAVDKKIVPTDVSKFSQPDLDIMNKYASELQKMGSKPTMAQLDAFVSRMPKEIQALKATNKIQFNTNAERIVRSHLDDLRTALGKAGTKEYSAARAKYADLSQFVNEGASHLGKITQSGDFAKDASLAKSAVQSVLNNGKKDWLIKLEQHTGYPALDDSVLALQAMKDAGDFKGNSLLEKMTENMGDVPSHGGLILGLYKGAKAFATDKIFGDKAEQTRAYLRSLQSKRK